jgi:tetratricopeptide (TPR) repeat protein
MDMIVDGRDGWLYMRPKPPVPVHLGLLSRIRGFTYPAVFRGLWSISDNLEIRPVGLLLFSGDADRRVRDYGSAIADYDRAGQIDPRCFSAFDSLGNACNDAHRFDRAIGAFARAVALDPNNVTTIANQGYAYLAKGDFGAAAASYSRAIALKPKDGACYFMRAQARQAAHDSTGADADYARAHELDPKYIRTESASAKATPSSKS